MSYLICDTPLHSNFYLLMGIYLIVEEFKVRPLVKKKTYDITVLGEDQLNVSLDCTNSKTYFKR